MRLAEERAFEVRQEFIGQTMTILTEKSEEGRVFGHTDNFLPVYIEGLTLPSNQLVTVKLIGNTPESLIGQVLSED